MEVLDKVPEILATPGLTSVPDQVKLPVEDGAPQKKLVPTGIIPLVPVVGVRVNVPSLQTTAVIVLICAIGFTVTVTLNCAPVHPLEVGVTK